MKRLIAFAIVVALITILCGCNYKLVDTKYNFNYGIIELPNGEIVEGKVQSWRDYKDGDQLQVKIDGVTYLTHASNVVLEER